MRRVSRIFAIFTAVLVVANLATGQWILAAGMAVVSAGSWRALWVESRPRSLSWSWVEWAIACANGIWGFFIAWFVNRYLPDAVPDAALLAFAITVAVAVPLTRTMLMWARLQRWRADAIREACVDAIPVPWPSDQSIAVYGANVAWDLERDRVVAEREALFREWMAVRMPVERKVRLIGLGVPAKAAAQSRLDDFTDADIDIYEAMADFSENGWTDRS